MISGKSQIALEYVSRHRIEYQGVFWIQADFHESLVRDFVQIARLLMLPEQDNQNQYVIVEAVKHYLDTHKCWLLIFDNVEEFQLLSNFLPADRMKSTFTRGEGMIFRIIHNRHLLLLWRK
jgi:hypothetical protein